MSELTTNSKITSIDGKRVINLADIDRSKRSREQYNNIDELAESIREIGLIQPIVLNETPEGTIELAAGGRRCKALELAGVTQLWEGETCNPERIGFVFRQNMREDEVLEVELEENLQREGFTWTEEVLLLSKVHAAKVKHSTLKGEKWGQRQTGKLLNVSLGYVSNMLTLAEFIRKGDADILKAGGVTEALKVLMERQENAAQLLLAQKAGVNIGNQVPSLPLPNMPNLSVDLDPMSPVHLLNKTEDSSHTTITPKERMTIKLSNHLFLGDSVNDILPRWPDVSIDHIVTDIPYGVDMDNMEGIRNIERVADEHDVGENVALMPKFLAQSYRILKEGGFCVFFYDMDHHEKLQKWAIEVGFRVQRWPLVWVKDHRCKNDAAAFNFTKTIETAMVLRKGTATLAKPQPKGHINADGSVERKMYDNPFAKPFAVWKFIYDAIAIQGQKVLDPFAGEMSATRAAVVCGLTPYAIELKDIHYNRGIEHFKEAYRLLTAGNVEFLP